MTTVRSNAWFANDCMRSATTKIFRTFLVSLFKKISNTQDTHSRWITNFNGKLSRFGLAPSMKMPRRCAVPPKRNKGLLIHCLLLRSGCQCVNGESVWWDRANHSSLLPSPEEFKIGKCIYPKMHLHSVYFLSFLLSCFSFLFLFLPITPKNVLSVSKFVQTIFLKATV